MKSVKFAFSNSSTQYFFDAGISHLKKITEVKRTIIVTDENIYNAHASKLKGFSTIVIQPGEAHKNQATVNHIVEQLIALQADRKTTLVGIGGGVVTDITGYVASIYMRGIPFGFVPTTILALVDASIGGKNGIDVGLYKNMVGIIRQPNFILHDLKLLQSLPHNEWVNGFAEIIKHACIKNAAMFKHLEQHTLEDFKKKKTLLADLVYKNATIKIKVVQQDEFEQNERRLLNFGHTLGHAIENQYGLAHGEAIAVGMVAACQISAKLTGFKQTQKVAALIQQYELPTYTVFNKEEVLDILKMDKKRERKEMNYILLNKIGQGVVQSIPLNELNKLIGGL